MTKRIILIFAFSYLFINCNNKAKEQPEAVSQMEHQHNDQSHSIELNNGKKWKVDENMMIHIRNMEKDVSEFGKTNSKDYNTLAKKIKQNIDLLTSNCTMSGKSHDELHKWLVPYIELVDTFSKEKSANQFREIQNTFKTFNQYFQ